MCDKSVYFIQEDLKQVQLFIWCARYSLRSDYWNDYIQSEETRDETVYMENIVSEKEC